MLSVTSIDTRSYLQAVEAEMQAVLRFPEALADPFFGMLHYHMGWADADFTPRADTRNGKRVRPLLCLLACQAAGGDWQQALPAAAAIELLHNFSLIHDDIEDRSPLRRGRPTLWQLWGEAQTINSGDAMFALSHLALARLADRGVADGVVVSALRRFDEMCLALTIGQYHDMAFEEQAEVTVAAYLAMIAGKTAALLAYATEIGALIAGADAATVAHYAQFGRELGLAFQALDDVLGVWGDEALIGKSAESDIVTKKKTLPVLYGLSRSAELRAHYQEDAAAPGFVERAVALLDGCGARTFAMQHATAHSDAAVHHLEAAAPAGAAGAALRQLTDQLLRREN